MNRRTSLALAVVGLLAAFAIAGPASAANKGVSIGEANNRYFFGPATVFVNAGDTVTWTNGSDAPHTVTSDSGTALSSSDLPASATYKHTFATVGTFAYHCTIHSYMTGKVVVLAAGAPLPATDTSPAPAMPSGSLDSGLVLVLLAGLAAGGMAIRRFRQVDEG